MNWKILTVDDDRGMRFLIGVALGRHGFEVIEASDGQSAIDQAQTMQPHLILMDIMMPKMDGITACKILRNMEETAHIPIIHLSAATSLEDKASSLASGAHLYWTKPISPVELAKRVDEVLQDYYGPVSREQEQLQEVKTGASHPNSL